MQQDLEQIDRVTTDAPLWTPALRRRVLLGLIVLLSLILLVVVPPYFSIGRYQRRVAAAISSSLGRPVHFDEIKIHLLPLPGLTITNFVVSESQDFGYEPILRANSVEARLRVLSLWRRRIEVSRISLDSPSINLVRRREDGRWNLQAILMQASQMNSAPTAQKSAGDAPRFPYIEATDARINIKDGDSKLPFSLKEAEFALWLPQPDQWRLRMVSKPVRTDTDVNDVGLLRVEATLGRAADLENAPIDLSASWKSTPLGEAAKLVAGYDLGWRGEASATATLQGKLGAAKMVADLHLLGLHRADYLPATSAGIDAHCETATAGLLRSLHDLRCAIPTDNSLTLASVMEALRKLPEPSKPNELPGDAVKPGVLLVQGEVPNVLDWHMASGSASLTDAPAEYAMMWARLFLQSIPVKVQVGGAFDLTASTEPAAGAPRQWGATLTCRCTLPVPSAQSTKDTATIKDRSRTQNRWMLSMRHSSSVSGAAQTFNVFASPAPDSEKNTGSVPSEPLLQNPAVSGEVTRSGYTLRYSLPSAVEQAATVMPFLGEDLPPEATGALVATGDWYRPPVWTAVRPVQRPAIARKRQRR